MNADRLFSYAEGRESFAGKLARPWAVSWFSSQGPRASRPLFAYDLLAGETPALPGKLGHYPPETDMPEVRREPHSVTLAFLH